jgi:hypothetical protein
MISELELVEIIETLNIEKNLLGSSRKYCPMSSQSSVFYPVASVSLEAVAADAVASSGRVFRRANATNRRCEAR